MRRALWLVLALPLLGVPLAGCGGTEEERAERGLAPADEESTPESEKAMQETEQQRQQQVESEMEKKQQEEFDAANSGKAP
jgi:hypothetical protein